MMIVVGVEDTKAVLAVVPVGNAEVSVRLMELLLGFVLVSGEVEVVLVWVIVDSVELG